MCKYEMDPGSIVEDKERTRLCPQTDRRTDKVKPVYTAFNFFEAEDIISSWIKRRIACELRCRDAHCNVIVRSLLYGDVYFGEYW